jgi:hypothetical protein
MIGRINMATIREKAMESAKFARAAQDTARAKFNKAKAGVLRDFLSDTVTREIRGGNMMGNSSGTLGGYGNLFSYIGFYEGLDPIAPVEEYLRSFPFMATVSKSSGGVRVRVKWPTMQTIRALTPMPWEEGNSWVEGIERGISGFGNYMYDLVAGRGRSRAAVQKKGGTGAVTAFSTRKYLPTMLAEAQRRFRKF